MNQALQELTQKTEKTIKAKERKTKRIKEQIKFYSWTILMITAGVCYTISYYELQVFRADYLTATGHATRIIENRRNDQLVAPKEEATNGHEQPVSVEEVTSDTTQQDRTITVTSYNAEVGQTDADPFTMASGKRVYEGAIATNCYPIGTQLQLEGLGTFTVEDRMNARFTQDCGTDKERADIFKWDRADNGKWQAQLTILS